MGGSILFHGEQRLVRGRKMPVKVVVSFDAPTKVRGVHATFRATERTEAQYTVTTTDSQGKQKTETKTAIEYSSILHQPFLLMGDERQGCLGRLLDSLKTIGGGGKHVLMQTGEEEFELLLWIPDDAPASFAGEKCGISYSLDVQVDVPIKVDWTESLSFEVDPIPVPFVETQPVHTIYPDEDSGRSLMDQMFGKGVTLNLAVDRDSLAVGETAHAMMTVETPEPLRVNDITVGLSGLESKRADGHSDSYVHWHELDDIDSPNIISSESVYEFDIVVPPIEGPFSQQGVNFEVNWYVEVRLDVPWAVDPVIRVPVKLLPFRQKKSESRSAPHHQ